MGSCEKTPSQNYPRPLKLLASSTRPPRRTEVHHLPSASAAIFTMKFTRKCLSDDVAPHNGTSTYFLRILRKYLDILYSEQMD
ncbi:hypothetical protein AVEN_251781-1 [Araneus ventricosus]|uniref:Uncharacterized protein n=1 Tax=Araneus ventricosus TaxID=182803 RepID=A0A4Y2N8P4_ARAVE|nr:hypothetical protein AVEN_251781-1 [Araneus ventricosus]